KCGTPHKEASNVSWTEWPDCRNMSGHDHDEEEPDSGDQRRSGHAPAYLLGAPAAVRTEVESPDAQGGRAVDRALVSGGKVRRREGVTRATHRCATSPPCASSDRSRSDLPSSGRRVCANARR